jgi:uncharacterized protein YkwD
MVWRSFVVLSLLFCQLVLPVQSHAQQPDPYAALTTEVLALVNAHRTGMGLKPLTINKTIGFAAMSHSRNMANKKIPFGHDGFDGRMERLSKQLKPTYSFAENVAMGATTAQEVVTQWLNSPGHKKNIEGDYNLTGIGIVKGKDGNLYYTQIFINRAEQ